MAKTTGFHYIKYQIKDVLLCRWFLFIMSKIRIDNYSSIDCSQIQPQAMSGYIFTLKSVSLGKEYRCSVDCPYIHMNTNILGFTKCPKTFIIRKGCFSGDEVVINMIATKESNGKWTVDNQDVKIVDEKGFVYGGVILCEDVEHTGNIAKEGDIIHSQTQVDLVYVFPGFPKRRHLYAILVINGSQCIRFTVREGELDAIFSADHYAQIENNTRLITVGANQGDRLRGELLHKINTLKVDIYKRLNNTLTSIEAIRLEDRIETNIYAIYLEVESIFDVKMSQSLKAVINDFYSTIDNYHKDLEKRRIEQQEYSIKINHNNTEKESTKQKTYDIEISRLSELQQVNPFQFEHICAEYLKDIGYGDIMVTKQSSDQGIDIMASKGEDKYVVQCKRWKGFVGSPEIQQFIGAMRNAHVENGLFITTSTFSRNAEIMAQMNNIELVDRTQLIKHFNLLDD